MLGKHTAARGAPPSRVVLCLGVKASGSEESTLTYTQVPFPVCNLYLLSFRPFSLAQNSIPTTFLSISLPIPFCNPHANPRLKIFTFYNLQWFSTSHSLPSSTCTALQLVGTSQLGSHGNLLTGTCRWYRPYTTKQGTRPPKDQSQHCHAGVIGYEWRTGHHREKVARV